jgi:hypothetical protein
VKQRAALWGAAYCPAYFANHLPVHVDRGDGFVGLFSGFAANVQ